MQLLLKLGTVLAAAGKLDGDRLRQADYFKTQGAGGVCEAEKKLRRRVFRRLERRRQGDLKFNEFAAIIDRLGDLLAQEGLEVHRGTVMRWLKEASEKGYLYRVGKPQSGKARYVWRLPEGAEFDIPGWR